MRNRIFLLILMILPYLLRAQEPLSYHVEYKSPGDGRIHISMVLSESANTPVSLVMPRNYPGGYGHAI